LSLEEIDERKDPILMIVYVVVHEKKAQIVGDLPEDLEMSLPNLLGYHVKMKDKYGVLSKRLNTKYNRLNKTVPVGLLDRLLRIIEDFGHEAKVLDKREIKLVDPGDIIDRMKDFPYKLRPYQIQAFAKGIQEPLMTFSMSTGSGKTVVFGALAGGMGLKTLVLINREDILAQHFGSIKKMFPDVGLIQGKQLDFDKQICVGMVQTIDAKLKKKGERAANPKYHMTKYLESIEYLISDEMHHSQSATWKRIVRLCKNKQYHHGFSGSPWDRGSANLDLECVCGAIKFKVTSSDLIRDGYLSIPHIFFHEYKGSDEEITGGSFQELYTNSIVECTARNKAIVKVVEQQYNETNNKILVIVNRIKHGEILSTMLRRRGIDDRELGYLHGGKGKLIREKGKKKFERGDIRILIASQIFNEGIDIPSCDVLVKADALGGGESVYESEGVRSFVQQIGRVLRKPVEEDDVDTSTPHHVYIHDFVDRQNKYVLKHTENRIRTCKMEPGFIVHLDERSKP
jgi:superfamily II DNA or RNA helicase